MKRVRFALWVLVLLVMAPQTHAQILIDYPAGGMLHHQTEPSAVWFDCSRLSENRISCTFTQFKAYIVGYPSVDESLGTLWPARDEKAAPTHERSWRR